MQTTLSKPLTAFLLLGIAACVAGPSPELIRRHKSTLRSAERALGDASYTRAIEYAERVDHPSTPDSLRIDARLLIAQAQLAEDDYEAAEATARSMRDDFGEEPEIDELEGKILFRQGKFSDAVSRFERAAEAHGEDKKNSRRRAEDLIHLARGFGAYEELRIQDAEQHWNQIRDPQLRDSTQVVLNDINTRKRSGSL